MEQVLISQYNQILTQEEVYWKLKSRINWLNQGDADTRFFHLSALKRRRRNKIFALKILQKIGFLKTILSQAEATSLALPVTDQEIIDDVYSFQPLKSPGLDGLPTILPKILA